jgi:hypothetical protein
MQTGTGSSRSTGSATALAHGSISRESKTIATRGLPTQKSSTTGRLTATETFLYAGAMACLSARTDRRPTAKEQQAERVFLTLVGPYVRGAPSARPRERTTPPRSSPRISAPRASAARYCRPQRTRCWHRGASAVRPSVHRPGRALGWLCHDRHSTLYGAIFVKGVPQGSYPFSRPSVSLFDLGSPFLRPDPRDRLGPARAGAVKDGAQRHPEGLSLMAPSTAAHLSVSG